MPASASDSYLNTRTTLMSSQLLDSAGVEALVDRTLDQLGRDFQLDQLVAGLPPEADLGRVLERTLIQVLMQELSVLLRPLDGPARNILIHWARKYELFNLKAIIRGKLQGLHFDLIKENLHDLPPLITLPHEQLLRTENIQELLRQLETGPYSDIARQARQVYEERNEPFSLDATLDQRYYMSLLRRVRRAQPTDRVSLHRLIGELIDQQNLNWLIRYRFNYELSASETYYLLIPFGLHLHRDQLLKLVNMDNIQQLIESLPAKLATALEGSVSPMEVEQALQTETTKQIRRCLQYEKSVVSRTFAYLVLREIDLKKLFAIIQGKALNLDQALIRTAAGAKESDLAPETTGNSDHV